MAIFHKLASSGGVNPANRDLFGKVIPFAASDGAVDDDDDDDDDDDGDDDDDDDDGDDDDDDDDDAVVIVVAAADDEDDVDVGVASIVSTPSTCLARCQYLFIVASMS